jgi:hypothetical protein
VSSNAVSRAGARIGWIATGALAAAMLGHALGLVSQAALDHVGLASLGWVVFRLGQGSGLGRQAAAAAAVGLVAVLELARLGVPGLCYMPYLMIIPANLIVAWLFANGLRPGREPILLQLIEAMGVAPADDPRFRRFIARQCLLWTGLSLATACVALAALVSVGSRPWLAGLLVGLFSAQATWFVLSHHYASLRYGRPEGWWTTARAMTRSEIRARLRIS